MLARARYQANWILEWVATPEEALGATTPTKAVVNDAV